MTRHAWTFALALVAPALVFAAPSPSVREVTAEAVLKPLNGNPRGTATTLASTSTYLTVANTPGAASRLSGLSDPTRWLASHLQASVDEKRGTVTVRLVGCPSNDAVALLT